VALGVLLHPREPLARTVEVPHPLDALPEVVRETAAGWELELGDPYLPGGQCAWVAPARSSAGDELVLKVAWRHREAEHEADGLRHWDGDGAVRCFASRSLDETTGARQADSSGVGCPSPSRT
jgi:hypothetical protein